MKISGSEVQCIVIVHGLHDQQCSATSAIQLTKAQVVEQVLQA
jgi:hypothetical protein